MRLSKDKTTLIVNPSLTLSGIPPETFSYRLGNRSALEWVIDQYQVSEDQRSGIRSDPNRPDDPEYIVRLVGQVGGARQHRNRPHRRGSARRLQRLRRGFNPRRSGFLA